MDTKSQFAGRYKTDMSIENFRAKVARRKSVTQKENRHKEFRKSRGLALVDVNVSVLKEQDLTVLEEVNETLSAKAFVNKTAVSVKNKENVNARRTMLQRFREEKQLRKLKEQREKASKGVFKCGIYKPEASFIPVPASQHAAKTKPKEKPAQPAAVTRVTRSAAKIEAPGPYLRSRTAQVSVLNSKVPDCTIPKGRGQTSVLKQNEKENKAITFSRTTRATAAASRLPTVKGAVKNTSVVKPQRRTKETSEVKQEIALTKPEPPVLVQEKTEKLEPGVAVKGKLEPAVSVEEKLEPAVAVDEKLEPAVAVDEKLEPAVAVDEKLEPAVAVDEKLEPAVAVDEKLEPAVAVDEKLEPAVAVEEKLEPAVAIQVTATETSASKESKPSFAPENFIFQPLNGLSTFQFQPMTPNRANAFLTPTFTWSPVFGKSKFVFTREHETEENKSPQVSPPDFSLKTLNVALEMDTYASPEAKDIVSSTLPVGEDGPPACDQHVCMPTDHSVQLEEAHDVPYFRGLVDSEIQRLTLLCSEWEKRIDQDIPEDSKDLIRTTVGQTRLLITERFKQFKGLMDNCEFKLGEKETTCTDLAGFWDMIYFQIEDVSKKFVNLGKLEENSWQQTSVQTKKVVRKKSVPAATVNKSQGDDARAAARSRLASIKAAMRNKTKQEEIMEEAAVSEQPIQVEPVVFDAGFFRIESPAKLPGSLRRAKTSTQMSDTPKSTKKVQQNSDNPVGDGKEESADHIHIQKSPNPAKSPVRKALFDTQEESLQNQEHPVVTSTENTESQSVPQGIDMTKYLVPTTTVTESVADSPGFMEFSLLENRVIELEEDTKCEVTATVVDDVFMCSPEKVQETELPSPKDGTVEILPDEDLKTSSNPLEFLGSCTSDTVMHTPLKSESNTAISDLMVFSPMES